MIWIHLYHIILLRLLHISSIAGITLNFAILILRWRNIYWKAMVAQVTIIWSCSKLYIVMLCVTINRYHAITIFIWISSIVGRSNGDRVIFFLIKVRDIHVFTSFRVFTESVFLVISENGSVWKVCIPILVPIGVRNYLNWLLSLIICSVH